MLEGKEYTLDDIHSLVVEGEGNHPSAIWGLYPFLSRRFNDDPMTTVHTSGSTGVSEKLLVRKDQMIQSVRLTYEFLDLKQGETVLLCMGLRYIGAMMIVARSLITGLSLIVRQASGHPLADVNTPLRFAAMVSLQVCNTSQIPEEKEGLRQTGISIIGGGAVDKALEEKIRNLSNTAYSTYGMTETSSHIVFRHLNSAAASGHYYPFSSVELFLSSEDTLMINTPLVCGDTLQTNDITYIYPDGSFTILGREDSVINNGGVKVQIEEVERLLQSSILVPSVITSVLDRRLGQAATLLIEGQMEISALGTKLESVLVSYYRPKYIYMINHIPRTGSGRTNRKECHVLAESLQLLGRQE